jgi:tetratricopeptide (TPR) repeat protein
MDDVPRAVTREPDSAILLELLRREQDEIHLSVLEASSRAGALSPCPWSVRTKGVAAHARCAYGVSFPLEASMFNQTLLTRWIGCVVLAGLSIGAPAARGQSAPGKVPITTTSDEARRLYVQGRDLAEKLRVTDAHHLYAEAVAKDPSFALAYLGLANTAGTTGEFIEAVTHAVALSKGVSEGERHIIMAADAGLKGDPAGVLAHYDEAVRLFPGDERVLTLVGIVHFGRQEYEKAIDYFVRATRGNSEFTTPYNQLGYAYRFLGRYAEAESTFQRYTELLPNDPNPYDSYAELLMKMGRFDDSIKMYQKALTIDPNFVASYVGIGNDHLAAGRPDEARHAFAKLLGVARNTGERRLAHFWTAASYVHEGKTDKALAELQAEYALAEAEKDAGSMAGDLTQMGDVLRESGRLDEALARYAEGLAVIEKGAVPPELKAASRRNLLFEQGRVAATRGDIATAKSKADAYAAAIGATKRPFEVFQQHELAGLIALAAKDYAQASKELALANQQDPRILYLRSVALRGAGDQTASAAMATQAASFNGLSFNYAYVKGKARTAGS